MLGIALHERAVAMEEGREAREHAVDARVHAEVLADGVAGEDPGIESRVVEALALEPRAHDGHVRRAHREVDVAVRPAGVLAGEQPRREPAFQENSARKGARKTRKAAVP